MEMHEWSTLTKCNWHCKLKFSQFSSVAQSCPTLCNPMACSTPGLPVHHQLLEFTQIHVHSVGDVMQPFHPLFPFSSSLQSFTEQGFFQWVSSLHEVAKVLSFQLQHQSFQWIFRTDFLQDGLVGSPCSPRDSQESSPTPQFKSTNSSALSFLYSPILTSIHDYRKTRALSRWTFVVKAVSLLFNKLSRLVITFYSKEQASFNFMAAVTICSDFGASKNKVSHYSHYFPIYLPWSDGAVCHYLSFLNV